MTSPTQAALVGLARRFRFNEGLLQLATDGFADAFWTHRPQSGGNTAHWILGHVTYSRNGLLRMAGADVPSEDWEAAFGRGAEPGAGEDGPQVADLIERFQAAGERISAHFDSMSTEAAEAPAPYEMPDGSKTVGDVLHFMYFHETYHLGQIGYIRRLEGLPGFI